MINWKKISEHTPTNAGQPFIGEEATPFVPCIVWVCNTLIIRGGTIDVIRWDTKNKCWLETDMIGKWLYNINGLEITHFCDNVDMPTDN